MAQTNKEILIKFLAGVGGLALLLLIVGGTIGLQMTLWGQKMWIPAVVDLITIGFAAEPLYTLFKKIFDYIRS